jgi:hypothetical protein
MERETLKQAVRRYPTILRFISDDRAIAVLTDMLTEIRDRLSKPGQTETRAYKREEMPKARSKDRHNWLTLASPRPLA